MRRSRIAIDEEDDGRCQQQRTDANTKETRRLRAAQHNRNRHLGPLYNRANAKVAELADAPDLGSGG